MALRLSTGLRTALLGGATGTAGFKTLMDGGVLDIYSGSQPLSADYVETGTKLVRISATSGTGANDGLKFGTAAAGAIGLTTPLWSGVVLATGVAGWFRFYGTGGTSGSSASQIRFDGAVGVAGADLNLSHTNLVALSTITITAADMTEPAE